MLSALALCLVSPFALPASAASGSDLEVTVVSRAGQTVPGMQVLLESNPVDDKLRVARAVSDGPARLVLPELGSIVFRLPAEAQLCCSARLYALGASAPGALRERLPMTRQDLEVRAGSARCDLVGPGLELEYEISGLGSSQPAVGRLVGPTRPGQVVTLEVPAPPPELRVLARLVDEDGKPLAHASIQWRYTNSMEFPGLGGCEGYRGLLASDESGRIALPIQGARLATSRPGAGMLGLTLVLGLSCPPLEQRSGAERSVRLRIPPFRSGQDLDLGEQRVTRFGSPRRYGELDDATLQRVFLQFEDGGFIRAGGDVHTEMLCEMVRRGGKGFERFIAEVLLGLEEHSRGVCEVNELLLLTALDRLRGRPDPLTIRRKGPEELELELPGSIEFAFEIENSAPENGLLALPPSGKWPRPAIEIHDAHGRRIPQPLCLRGSERHSWSPLAPGESRELRVQSETLSLPGPGDYRVRVHCSPGEDLDQLSSLDGRIYFSSAEFTLHVRARSAR